MQQDNNHIENSFRQLENQQLPDLSNMDKHWQDMEQMLKADNKPKAAKPRSFFRLYGRKLFIAAAIISMVFALWLIKNRDTSEIQDPRHPIVNKSTQSNSTAQQNGPGTEKATAGTNTQSGQSGTPGAAHHKIQPGHKISTDTALAQKVLTAIPGESIASFYQKIQKPVQEFTINADEGGRITAKEGTVLVIPAAAFTDEEGKIISGNVKIFIEEFYKYADMIAANLTTTSDGKQLLTGGMIKLTATANGSELILRNNKGIALAMPTKNLDPEMKLFTSNSEPAENQQINSYASFAVEKRNLNWNLTGSQNVFPVFDGKTYFPNNLDNPYNVIKTSKKRIGKFALSDKSRLSTEEMKKILQEKYGDFYDVIKVKKESDPGRSSNLLYRGTVDKDNVIGDSSRMTVEQALKLKCIERKEVAFYLERIKADSLLYIKRFIANLLVENKSIKNKGLLKEANYELIYNNTKSISLDSLDKIYNEYLRLQKAYTFTVKQLGWINCDKYANCNKKTNFIINLPADVQAEKFVSQVVFISTRSVMPGRTIRNQIGFQDIPADVGVYVVGLGERNGKVVSFMQKLTVGRAEVNIHDLQETTPEAFRIKIAELDIN